MKLPMLIPVALIPVHLSKLADMIQLYLPETRWLCGQSAGLSIELTGF